MLQQTRVDTVIPYYERFLARFPTVHALAEAPEDDVLSRWSGLGYYRRARLLHRGAQAVARLGAMPPRREALLALPGIGPYTAGAVASIAFGEPVGLVDGNVARVLARIFAIDADMRGAGMRAATKLADSIVSATDPGSWNQALMELGATVCTPQKPDCGACPVRARCRAYATDRVEALPVLAPKRKPLARKLQALVGTNGERVLFAQRRPDQLFGGLWEPPCAEGAVAARRALLDRFGATAPRVVGQITHVLSHRKLTVEVVRAEVDGRAARRALPPEYVAARLLAPTDEALDRLGIATLAKKILAAAVIR